MFRFSAETRGFYLLQHVHPGCATHRSAYLMSTGIVFPGDIVDQDVNLTTRRHLVPKVKNNWSNTYTPSYAFME